MKYLIIFGISFFLLSNINESKAQSEKIKKDTIYYLLDTASVPIKDRMFEIQKEADLIAYVLRCKCFPWETDPFFFSLIRNTKDVKNISREEFNKIKTISLSELTDIVVKYGKDKINKNIFYFIEPKGGKMIMTRVSLARPSKPHPPINDGVFVKPEN